VRRSGSLVAAALLAAAAGPVPAAGPGPAGSVTFLAGEATRLANGKPEKLALGSLVYESDVVETRARTRLELTLQDQSLLRLGPQAKVRLATATFGRSPEDRKVSAELVVGDVWAKVTKAIGAGGRFEVQTENAVAGVRGTTFRVDARADRSCVVKVYGGAVAVAGGAVPRPAHQGGKKERKQVAGPREVTREQWERLVGKMMQVAIAPDGTPGDPEAFALAAPGQDEWEEWNRARDGAAE
jgi:hypothetical protein